MTYSLKRVRGRRGFMEIKIDLKKAYDHLNWKFLRNCLEECNLPSEVCNEIMEYITSSSFQV